MNKFLKTLILFITFFVFHISLCFGIEQCENFWQEGELVYDYNSSENLHHINITGGIVGIKLPKSEESLILRKKIYNIEFPVTITWIIKASESTFEKYNPSVNIILDPPDSTSAWWNDFMGGGEYEYPDRDPNFNDAIKGIVCHFSNDSDWRRFGVDVNVEGNHLSTPSFSWYPVQDSWETIKIVIHSDKTELWANDTQISTYNYDFTQHTSFAWAFGDQQSTLVQIDSVCVNTGNTECYTENDIQNAIETGRNECINDPNSCGLSRGLYTEEDMLNMVNKLLEWDVNKDKKIGLLEVVQTLRDLTGVKKEED